MTGEFEVWARAELSHLDIRLSVLRKAFELAAAQQHPAPVQERIPVQLTLPLDADAEVD